MNRRYVTAMALAALVGLSATATGKSPVAKKAAPCGDYGTSVQFEDSPAAAAVLAKKEEKLVLVLHVSGHFEDPALT